MSAGNEGYLHPPPLRHHPADEDSRSDDSSSSPSFLQGKRFLLPLRKSERNRLIVPWSLKISSQELKQAVTPTAAPRHIHAGTVCGHEESSSAFTVSEMPVLFLCLQASGGLQVLSISLLCGILLTVDFALVHVLDIISRHTFTQFNVTSKHTPSHTHLVQSWSFR